MSKKINCWEFFNCGREKGGLLTSILGECPVSSVGKLDGVNQGVNGGRACWLVPNSSCAIKETNNLTSCRECSFYNRVRFEQEVLADFINPELEEV